MFNAMTMVHLQSSYCFDIIFMHKQIQTYCFGMIVMLSCPLHRKSVIKSGLSTLAWHVIIIGFPTGRRCDCVGKISSRGFSQFTLSTKENKNDIISWMLKKPKKYSNKLLFLFLFLSKKRSRIQFNSVKSNHSTISFPFHSERRILPWMAMSMHQILCQIQNLYSIYFACINNNDNG